MAVAQVGAAVEEVAHRLAQLGLLHDLLLRPAAGVHVRGRRAGDAAPEPVEALVLARRPGRVALAVAEDAVDALAGATRELGQVLLRRHVEVGEVDDGRRQRPAAVVGVGGHDDDPREVDAGEGAEVDDLAVGDPVPHLCQQRSSSSAAPSRTGATTLSADWYGTGQALKSSAKWRSLDRSQKTRPR